MLWLSDITSIIREGRNLLRYYLTGKINTVLTLFFQIHTKHLTVTIDAFTIHNRYFDIKENENGVVFQIAIYRIFFLSACGWERRQSFLTRRILPWWCDLVWPVFFCFFSTEKYKERNEGNTTLAADEKGILQQKKKLGYAAEIWLVNSFLGLSACNDPFAPSRRILNSWILSSYIYCTFLKWENYFLTDTRIWQTENSSSPDSSPRTNDEL